MKGIVHGAIAAAAAAEACTARTNLRRLLLGLAVGWHLYATYDHIFVENAERTQKEVDLRTQIG